MEFDPRVHDVYEWVKGMDDSVRIVYPTMLQLLLLPATYPAWTLANLLARAGESSKMVYCEKMIQATCGSEGEVSNNCLGGSMSVLARRPKCFFCRLLRGRRRITTYRPRATRHVRVSRTAR